MHASFVRRTLLACFGCACDAQSGGQRQACLPLINLTPLRLAGHRRRGERDGEHAGVCAGAVGGRARLPRARGGAGALGGGGHTRQPDDGGAALMLGRSQLVVFGPGRALQWRRPSLAAAASMRAACTRALQIAPVPSSRLPTAATALHRQRGALQHGCLPAGGRLRGPRAARLPAGHGAARRAAAWRHLYGAERGALPSGRDGGYTRCAEAIAAPATRCLGPHTPCRPAPPITHTGALGA